MECELCGKQGDARALPRCSRCKMVRYCRHGDCQARDWPRHRVTCRAAEGAGGAAAEPGGASRPADGEGATSRPSQDPPRRAPPAYSPEAWHNLFSTLFPTTSNPAPSTRSTVTNPWQQARSRAAASFSGERVTDLFDDDDLDLTDEGTTLLGNPLADPFSPFRCFLPFAMPPMVAAREVSSQKVLVMKLVTPQPILFCVCWEAQDYRGGQLPVLFDIGPQTTGPHFRYEDLQSGVFVCVKHPKFILVQGLGCMVQVHDAAAVRVFTV